MSLWRGAIYRALIKRKQVEDALIGAEAGWCFVRLIVKIAP